MVDVTCLGGTHRLKNNDEEVEEKRLKRMEKVVVTSSRDYILMNHLKMTKWEFQKDGIKKWFCTFGYVGNGEAGIEKSECLLEDFPPRYRNIPLGQTGTEGWNESELLGCRGKCVHAQHSCSCTQLCKSSEFGEMNFSLVDGFMSTGLLEALCFIFPFLLV